MNELEGEEEGAVHACTWRYILAFANLLVYIILQLCEDRAFKNLRYHVASVLKNSLQKDVNECSPYLV